MGRLVGFLRSLAEEPFTWLEEALASGNSRVVGTEEDLLATLREARNRMVHEASSGSQGELL